MDRVCFVVDELSVKEPAGDADRDVAYIVFSEMLASARAAGISVFVPVTLWTAECSSGIPFSQRLYDNSISRDTRTLVLQHLSKLVTVEGTASKIRIDGSEFVGQSLSMILEEPFTDKVVGILLVWPYIRSGQVALTNDQKSRGVYCIANRADQIDFYRLCFDEAEIEEAEFFWLANHAFPELQFAGTLAFRRFDGSYSELRGPVVQHLTAINDKFFEAFSEFGSDSNILSTRVGVPMSIEGKTRGSEKLMKERDVEHGGKIYRCEWHSKIEPHRNRIHFYPGDPSTNSKVLIGIFVDHLRT